MTDQLSQSRVVTPGELVNCGLCRTEIRRIGSYLAGHGHVCVLCFVRLRDRGRVILPKKYWAR